MRRRPPHEPRKEASVEMSITMEIAADERSCHGARGDSWLVLKTGNVEARKAPHFVFEHSAEDCPAAMYDTSADSPDG